MTEPKKDAWLEGIVQRNDHDLKRYVTTGQPQFAGGEVFGTYNAPREWYATFGVKL